MGEGMRKRVSPQIVYPWRPPVQARPNAKILDKGITDPAHSSLLMLRAQGIALQQKLRHTSRTEAPGTGLSEVVKQSSSSSSDGSSSPDSDTA